MAFIVGIFLFVGVVGLVDRRLPWPSTTRMERTK